MKKNREYYINKLSTILGIVNIQEELEKEDLEKLLQVKKIFKKEYDFLLVKKNKLDKIRKKYLDSLIDDIDIVENRIKTSIYDYVSNNVENIIENFNDEYNVRKISDLAIKDQVRSKLSCELFTNKYLISKDIDNKYISYICDSLINYNMAKARLIGSTDEWEKLIRNLMFKDFPLNQDQISEKDKQEIEKLIYLFLDKFPDLYIIADTGLYNELEIDIVENTELLQEDNKDKLALLIESKKDKFIKDKNISSRSFINFKTSE